MITKTKFYHAAFNRACHKAKVSALTAAITACICQTAVASDIDIYTAPSTTAGATTMLFMLDTSGSMRFVDYASNSAGTSFSTHSPSSSTRSCPSGWSGSDRTITIGLTGASSKGRKSIDVYECRYGSRPVTMHRLSKLKVGLLQVLLGDYSDLNNKIEPLADEVYIGLATFAGNKGQIRLAARQLSDVYPHNGVTQTHRRHLVDIVAGLTPNGGTPTPFAYAEAGAYLMGTHTNNSTYGNSTTNYTPPSSISAQKLNPNLKECSAQGIYFLTDGRPEPNTGSSTASSMMSSALSGNNSGWSCTATTSSKLGLRGGYYNSNHSWNCVGRFTQRLLDPDLNPAGIKIMTAVVGFGKDFDGSSPTNDVLDAMDWGILGEGGWYSGQNPEDIVESVQSFLGIIKTDIPGVSTGNATVPVDALNSNTVQPYGYFPQFVPKVAPTDLQQTWFGNLKKYHAVKGSLYGNYNKVTNTASNPVMRNDAINDVADLWNNAAYIAASNETAFKHGVLSNMLRGFQADRTPKQRLVLSDYFYNKGTPTKYLDLTYAEGNQTKYRAISHDYTTNEFTRADPKLPNLMSLLGYKDATNGTNLTNVAPHNALPQMGAILHSQPILLTQEGLPVVNSVTGAIDTANRKDYVLFGTTQGVLHVVDAKYGKEVFAFVPEEMLRKQPKALNLDAAGTTGGKDKLYYGVDGEWTAHTIYVAKKDGTLAVKGDTRTIVDDDGNDQNIDLVGKQWVYGGLRMGGRSYYALDLTEIDKPVIKFHIDPDNQKVWHYDPKTKATTSKTYSELQHMGQSWSKPTIAYVNWKGARKLVMFVGGGYDAGGTHGDGLFAHDGSRDGYAGYEDPEYTPANNRKIGAGVYMFDADNGDLLWSASGNHAATQTSGNDNLKTAAGAINMNFSVVSPIKTVDRNNDGLVDHLYFGDLKGQAFRVDINNAQSSVTSPFSAQANRILNVGENRRFYNAPTFTAHAQQGIVAVTFASGDRSSPMYGKNRAASANHGTDGVFTIFDYETYASATPTGTLTRTLNIANGTTAKDKLKLISNAVEANEATRLQRRPTINATNGDGGWYYLFDKVTHEVNNNTRGKQIVKALGALVAIENDLYVPLFDASKPGTTGACSAGVAGQTNIQRFCLPYGICAENINIELGSGIGEVIMAGGRDGDNNKRSILVLNENKKGGGAGGPIIKNYGGALKFIPNRWYERYADGGG